MKYLSYIVLFFLVESCSVSNEVIPVNENKIDSNQNEKENSIKENEIAVIQIPVHNVQILIRQYIPYCGGAYPSEDQLNNYTAYSGDIILINNKDSTRTVIPSFQNGEYYLNLEPGSYSIKEGYKNVTFEQFLSANNRGYSQDIVSGDDDCYKNWWKSTLHDFIVTDSEGVLTINCSISSSCYTDVNPCDYYIGPLPN